MRLFFPWSRGANFGGQKRADRSVALMFADVYRNEGNKAAAAMAVAHKEIA